MSQRGPGNNWSGGKGSQKGWGGDRRNDRPGGSGGGPNFNPGDQAGGSKGGTPIWTSEKLPHEKDSEGSSPGWKSLQNEEGLIVLPFKKDVASEKMKTITVKVNHFPIKIQFPQNIFSYKVAITKIRNNPDEVKPKPKGKKSNKQRGNEPENNPPGGEASSAVRPLKKYITAEVMSTLAAEIMRTHRIVVATDRVDILYSTKALEDTFDIQTPFVLQVHIDGSGNDARETFSVEILKRIESIDTGVLQQYVDESMQGQMPTPELMRVDQIYNILLKNLRNSRYTPIGRSALICFDGNGRPLGGGLVNYQGFDAVVGISGCWKPFINIHVANCASVVNRNVIDVLAELFNDSRENCLSISHDWGDDVKKATNLLRSCRVNYTPQPGMTRGGIVTKLDHRSISEITFPIQNPNGNETMISVYDYFVSRYNLRRLSRNGPALLLGGRNYVPAELCTVKRGQSVNRGLTLTGPQTNQMLRIAKKEPTELLGMIENSVQELKLTIDPVLQEFGCTVPGNVGCLTMDKTRVLAPPMICYGANGNDAQQKMRVTPDSGMWDFAQLRAKFLTPSQPVKKWGILLTCSLFDSKTNTEINGHQAASKFKDLLISKGHAAGLQFLTQPIIEIQRLEDHPRALVKNRETLTRLFDGQFEGCDFILVVIPAKKQCSTYTHVKQTAELPALKGMLTQCVSKESFTAFGSKLNTIVVNLLLKINSKLGGVNHVVCSPADLASAFTIFQEPVMILGADVTHPPAGSYKDGEAAKSFAAVTCSINRTGMPYLMHVQAQEKAAAGAAEVITGFDVIIKNCLAQFEKRTGVKPTKIIYFRDGVGSGQFPELLQHEMGKMRDGCTKFENGYEPAITFVTVQKRHKTRIFMKNGNAYQNPPPGTVVDTQIVHPTEHDFFLVSHYGALGTSRPSRYHVLWDDSDFSSDKLQQLTYYLCYMYVRCTKSVSIPAPTYYAHWAAKRAKVLAEGTSDKGVSEVNAILRASKKLLATYPMHFI